MFNVQYCFESNLIFIIFRLSLLNTLNTQTDSINLAKKEVVTKTSYPQSRTDCMTAFFLFIIQALRKNPFMVKFSTVIHFIHINTEPEGKYGSPILIQLIIHFLITLLWSICVDKNVEEKNQRITKYCLQSHKIKILVFAMGICIKVYLLMYLNTIIYNIL